jgi:hypothetical protein
MAVDCDYMVLVLSCFLLALVWSASPVGKIERTPTELSGIPTSPECLSLLQKKVPEV